MKKPAREQNSFLPIINNSLSHPAFDYTTVEPSVAIFLKGQADRIRRFIGKSFIQIGKDLLGTKRYLAHGEFIRWVEFEVGIPARSAQNYMQVAQWIEGKSATVAYLPPSLLYVLSARNTPDYIIEEVIKQIEAGQQVSVGSVREAIKESRKGPVANRVQPHMHEQAALNNDMSPSTWPAKSEDQGEIRAHIYALVSILWRGLEKADFLQVRQLLTNKIVVGDGNVARNISEAFTNLEITDEIGKESHAKARDRENREALKKAEAINDVVVRSNPSQCSICRSEVQ